MGGDSYDGSVSSETSEGSVETGSESSNVDTVEITVTDTEICDAFDEENGGENNTATTASAETAQDAEKDSEGKEDFGTSLEGISETEISSAFDEDLTETSDSSSLQETVEKTEPIHVTCTREDLAGHEHPETGVRYETKIVEVNGKQLEVTVPQFESKYDTHLEPEQLQADRPKHNEICNAKLKEYCDQNPEWAQDTFSQKQLDQINSGKNPEGYTWHHDGGEVGHMQLVDAKTHYDTRHTGGVAIWGNGSKYI